jgi:hypothetical protein
MVVSQASFKQYLGGDLAVSNQHQCERVSQSTWMGKASYHSPPHFFLFEIQFYAVNCSLSLALCVNERESLLMNEMELILIGFKFTLLLLN